MLNQQEINRYSRHIIMPEIGMEGQKKLKAARVLVIGAGGLGCPVLQYLTAAGVGRIGIIDFDVVDASNLQRQILFDTEDIGKPKVEVAISKLLKQNPFIEFTAYHKRLAANNALNIIRDYDIVVDGCDNFATRYLVNDACVILGKPFVFGSIFKFEGQVSVFNWRSGADIAAPTYRCLFPEPPSEEEAPNCATIGVLGILPGIVGTLQATETIKIIVGIGEPLVGKLLLFNALSMSFHSIKFKGLIANQQISQLQESYEEVCAAPEKNIIQEISAEALKAKIDAGEPLFLLDVREKHEHEICNLGGHLIPMNDVAKSVHQIPKDVPVVVFCHHGSRSASVIHYLIKEHQFTNLLNLEGGIHQWALEIDESMEVY